MDPVVTSLTGSASPAYQYLVKKKSLSLAAEILQKGTKSLSLSTTDKEKEFHKALSSLRQRWRLKRIGSGAIIGDLSYHSGKPKDFFGLVEVMQYLSCSWINVHSHWLCVL